MIVVVVVVEVLPVVHCPLLFAGETVFEAMSRGVVHCSRKISEVLIDGLIDIDRQQNVRVMHALLLARLIGQYCYARWRLSSSVVVCNAAGRQADRRTRSRSGGRHCTAGQYGYIR